MSVDRVNNGQPQISTNYKLKLLEELQDFKHTLFL